jgi:hypothetical protein
MKKLLVKIKVIDVPYSPLIPAIPEKWVKDEVELLEQPMIEQVTEVPAKWTKDELEVFEEPMIEVDGVLLPDDSYTYHEASELKEMVNDESYTYHEGFLEVPEVLEESHEEVIAQTQGSDEELAEWLAGDSFKYPEGYWVEYVDISSEINAFKALQDAQNEISKGMKGLAVFKVKVKEKSLTTQQIGQLFSDPAISRIIATLSTGSLPLAAALIDAYPADGVIVTEEDKLAVIKAIL